MKHTLVVEWTQIGNTVTGTCDRYSLTGSAMLNVLEKLQPSCMQKTVTAWFRETVLPDSQSEESNQVIVNGIFLEEYLSGGEVVQTPCRSCACSTGRDEAECRAIDYKGDRYEAIAPDFLKRVIVDIVKSGESPCCL